MFLCDRYYNRLHLKSLKRVVYLNYSDFVNNTAMRNNLSPLERDGLNCKLNMKINHYNILTRHGVLDVCTDKITIR